MCYSESAFHLHTMAANTLRKKKLHRTLSKESKIW